MLQLRNLQYEAPSKQFIKGSRKLIRFSYKNSIIVSKNICAFVNQATIKWNQGLRIPEVYGQDVEFQIYSQHQFGYNPEELQNLLYGSVRLTEGKTIGKVEVFSANDPNKRAGFLLFDIKKLVKKATKDASQPKVAKTVSSILVRNVIDSPQSGYITVNNGKKNYKSQNVEAIKGQFFYNMLFKNDSYLIKSTDPSDYLNVSFHLPDGKIIGKAQYLFKSDKTVTKIEMEDQFDGRKIGEIYFQVQAEETHKEGKEAKTDEKVAFKQEQQVAENNRAKPNPNATPSHFRSMSLTRLSNLNESQFLGTSRTKRMSVIHNNGDVVFPSEKRFMNYVDKQTNVISYSKLPSMKFQEEHSKKYYKGASIGVGNKSDFTAYYRYNPGVGQYKLPSIFDRY